MHPHIQNHYNTHDEESRLAPRHGQVEFLTTIRYIEKYLTPGARILDVGAGTGRYSHALARQGCAVDAVELVPHNIDIFKSNTAPGEPVTVTQGDARDLSAFSCAYDLTLVLGPLYHMFTADDKRQVISEALRVTKPGGVVFAAYCMSDASIMDTGFRRGAFSVADHIENGFIDAETFEASSAPELVFEVVRKEQIDAVMAGFDVERLHFVATDLYTNHMRDAVDEMDDAAFALYLRYHFSVCERADMFGLSHHTLDVFRKR